MLKLRANTLVLSLPPIWLGSVASLLCSGGKAVTRAAKLVVHGSTATLIALTLVLLALRFATSSLVVSGAFALLALVLVAFNACALFLQAKRNALTPEQAQSSPLSLLVSTLLLVACLLGVSLLDTSLALVLTLLVLLRLYPRKIG